MVKLESKVKELTKEWDTYKRQLDEKHYHKTYKENEQLKRQLDTMYILNEENKDLKEQLDAFKTITYDKRMKSLTEENTYL